MAIGLQDLKGGRRPIHDPAKVVVDLAIALALGGDCLADVGLLRTVPGTFGQVASDLTVSRTALTKDASAALRAINIARAAAHARVRELTGENASHAGIGAAARC